MSARLTPITLFIVVVTPLWVGSLSGASGALRPRRIPLSLIYRSMNTLPFPVKVFVPSVASTT